MKFRVIVAGILAAAIAAPAQAQTSVCASGASQDVCQKAVDLLNFMTPQLSTALVGGNPTLGQGGVLGGLGHFSIDIRASGSLSFELPKLSNVGLSLAGAQHSTFTSDKKPFGVPSVDAGIGLWRGFSLGVTHVGGVDAIVTMTYLPNIGGDQTTCASPSGGSCDKTNFTVNGSNEKFGYGFRLGLLEESVITPGVSFVWVQRDLPVLSGSVKVDASGVNPGGSIALNDFTVNTSAWRITAAKSFLIFGISAGAGQDKYTASSTLVASATGGPTATQPINFSMTRMNYFVGAYMNLFVFKLEAEYGQVTGGTVPAAFNTFGSDAASSRSYLTAGLRFGWGR
jgi:hypothetical protein